MTQQGIISHRRMKGAARRQRRLLNLEFIVVWHLVEFGQYEIEVQNLIRDAAEPRGEDTRNNREQATCCPIICRHELAGQAA